MASRRKTASRKSRPPAARKAPARAGPPGAAATARRKAAKSPKPAKSAKSKAVLPGAAGHARRLAGVGTDAVARATGRAWDAWLALLDRAGAARMPHRAIATLLAERFGLPPWWRQMVAVGYEQARGFRQPGQKADGFSASASRTVAAGVDRVFQAWADPALRSLWLGRAPVTVRGQSAGKSLRISWGRGATRVAVGFAPAGRGRSRVQVQHDRLDDDRQRQARKAYWARALDRLQAMLEKAA